jgi:hypothetical protein
MRGDAGAECQEGSVEWLQGWRVEGVCVGCRGPVAALCRVWEWWGWDAGSGRGRAKGWLCVFGLVGRCWLPKEQQ